MKILLLQDDFPPKAQGGAGSITFALALEFRRQGHDVLVLAATQDSASTGRGQYLGLSVEYLYSKYHERWQAYMSLYNPRTVTRVQEVLHEFRPDVVHAHNIHYHLSYHCLKIAKKSGARVFLTAHDVMSFHYGKLVEYINPRDLSCLDTFDYRISVWQHLKRFKKRFNPFRNMVIRRYLKYVDAIFAVSHGLKEALTQNSIQNVAVIHNGIDINGWPLNLSAVERLKEKYNLQDKKIILFGGRLGEAKGGHQALCAMAKVTHKVPNVVLLIVGAENAYTVEMKKLAEKANISGNLVFTGWLSGDELKATYHASDVLIAPSICFDSFPTVILEAMACGKPVVATCFGGAREMVADGQTGYIINPFNVILLAEKIIELLVNSLKAKGFGVAGLEKVKREFSLEKSAKAYLDRFS